MTIEAAVLCENSVFTRRGLIAEHGWSVFLETGSGRFLFDTGQGLGLRGNARTLGRDLRACRGIILSHHHWDHTGGLEDALAVMGGADVFAHPELFKESFRLKDGEAEPIGVPFSRGELEALGARFHFNRGFTALADGVFLTGEVPRRTDFERGDARLVVRDGGRFRQDPLLDDQALAVETDDGLFVLLGCSHSGVVNTLRYIMEKTGRKRIHTVLGGTHLGSIDEQDAERSIEALAGLDIGRIGVSHCTGTRMSLRLREIFGERFFSCHTGDVVRVP